MRNYQVIKIMKENVLVEGYFGNGLERRNIAKCNINPDIDLFVGGKLSWDDINFTF